MGACYDPGKFMIITELIKTDLSNIIHSNEYIISTPVKIKLAKDMASGLAWLHLSKPPILHRDIKPTNILVDSSMNAKLCDFGLSCIKKKKVIQDEGEAPGSPLWMSPEVLLGGKLNEKADVYAYAIVIWELFTAQDPFSQYNELDPFINAICHRGERPPIPDDMNELLKDLITKSWDTNPEVRPQCQEIASRLDDVLLSYCIHDVSGRNFWKTYFEGKREVSYRTFDNAFYRALSESYPPYPEFDDKHKCLTALLSTEKDDHSSHVSIERFGLLLDWFGPMEGMLDRILNAMSEDWFHGDITKDATDAKLSDFEGSKGTFLVRLSLNQPEKNPFSISMISRNGQVVHIRINRKKKTGKLRVSFKKKNKVENIDADTIEELVNLSKGPLSLGKVCPGRKYNPLSKKKGTYIMNNYDDDDDD